MICYLSLQSNRLVKIEGLDLLVNLKELYISHNGIERLEGLEHNVSHGWQAGMQIFLFRNMIQFHSRSRINGFVFGGCADFLLSNLASRSVNHNALHALCLY